MVIFINNFIKPLFLCCFFVLASFYQTSVMGDEHGNTENDPFESVNRNIFDFNNSLDDNLFKPVARGWRELPDIPRENIANLANTAKTPVSLANAILQLDKESIGNILGRFLMNMTFGLGGLFDVASTESFGGVEEVDEDFGQTLAVWGVPDGPYVMLPVFGPSSVRDTVGLGVDAITNPLSFGYRMSGIGMEARLTGPAVRGVDLREKYLDYVDEIREGSLDYYATMRSLYRQKRQTDISNGDQMIEDEVSFDTLLDDIYEDDEIYDNELATYVDESSSDMETTFSNEDIVDSVDIVENEVVSSDESETIEQITATTEYSNESESIDELSQLKGEDYLETRELKVAEYVEEKGDSDSTNETKEAKTKSPVTQYSASTVLLPSSNYLINGMKFPEVIFTPTVLNPSQNNHLPSSNYPAYNEARVFLTN